MLTSGLMPLQKAARIVRQLEGDWQDSVADDLRPKSKVRFAVVVALSAKSGEVDELKRVLRTLHEQLHEVKPIEFRPDEVDSGQVII